MTNTDNDTAGITVTPTSGLTTTEAGGTATFTIVLNSQPTADVTIGLSSNDTTEGTVSAASVTFTTANWNTPQTITVTGVNDAIDDGNIAYSIVTAAAVSGDPNYDDLDASDVSVTNTDDDTAGIIVTPTSGLITSEIGGEAPTFTVVLTSQPTANVVINLSSSDTTEGTVGPVSLTFTSANWNTPQTVTLHGVNDVVDDGDIPYSIVTAPATSGDPAYSGMNASDVSATNIDSDVAGFFVNPISGLTTTEAGGRAHFTVVLNTQPSADVTIALSSSDPSEGTVSPASLTFTSDNWNIPQTVDVTGVNDPLDDGDIAYTIVTAAAISADPGYNGLNPFDVSVLNIDNDTAGITVSPTFGLTTTESGGTATFTIVLNSQPTADVTIGLSSSDTSEGTVSPASVTFTTANWNTPQTVTVTGVNDLFDDGDIAYSIVTAAATSSDLRLQRAQCTRRVGEQHGRRHCRLHADPDLRSDHDRGRRHRDVHGGADCPADRQCDDRTDLVRHHRGHGQPGERDLHQRQLEYAADRHHHRRQRLRSTMAISPTTSSPRRRRAATAATTASPRATSPSPTRTTTRRASPSRRPSA